MDPDVFNYKEYWSESAIKRRKENKMYEKNEVDQVYEDIKVILDRFVDRLDQAVNSIEYAASSLGESDVEVIANLAIADSYIKKMDLVPVIDTLQGIVEGEIENE